MKWALTTVKFSKRSPCIRLARGKFELTNQDSAGGKKSSVLTSGKKVRKGIEIGQLFSLEMALNIHEKGFTIQNPYQFAKSEKYGPFCVSKLLFWHQKWVADARHGNSLVVRPASPGRIIVALFWTKYAVLRQIKPGILKFTTSRGKSNLHTAFSLLAAKKKAVIVPFR